MSSFYYVCITKKIRKKVVTFDEPGENDSDDSPEAADHDERNCWRHFNVWSSLCFFARLKKVEKVLIFCSFN